MLHDIDRHVNKQADGDKVSMMMVHDLLTDKLSVNMGNIH